MIYKRVCADCDDDVQIKVTGRITEYKCSCGNGRPVLVPFDQVKSEASKVKKVKKIKKPKLAE